MTILIKPRGLLFALNAALSFWVIRGLPYTPLTTLVALLLTFEVMIHLLLVMNAESRERRESTQITQSRQAAVSLAQPKERYACRVYRVGEVEALDTDEDESRFETMYIGEDGELRYDDEEAASFSLDTAHIA
jgi:hypothetical protein